MSAPLVASVPSPLATNQTRFDGRLPDPSEVVRWGGTPGCEYAYVAADNFARLTEFDWSIASGVKPLTIVGPKGPCQVVVLVRGEPIEGADPLNGIRTWFTDPAVFERTGLTSPYPGFEPIQPPPPVVKEQISAQTQAPRLDVQVPRQEADGKDRKKSEPQRS